MAKTKTTTTKTKSGKGLTLPMYDVKGKKVSDVEVSKDFFDVSASDKLIAQYVRVYRANQRKEHPGAQTRGDVTASTRKIYRQKGTGRARHGALSAPIFVGGGVAHGPKQRSFTLKINKKQRRKALYVALSTKRKNDNIIVVKGLEDLKGKTKTASDMLKALNMDTAKRVVFVYDGTDSNKDFANALSNIANVQGAHDRVLNAYDVLQAQKVIFSQKGIEDFQSFRSGKQS